MSTSTNQEGTDPQRWLTYVSPTLGRRSPLYAHLYQQMQQDAELFTLLSLVDPDQPVPVLFFSVVNFLVLGETDHPFAQWYPYVTDTPRRPEEAYPLFRDFCLTHQGDLRELLSSSRLQTNEVRRCANLLPAFELVFQRGNRQPLALIEIGASAGLNLNWFRYGYRYGEYVVGNLHASVQISCQISGQALPSLPRILPQVAQCQGIELFPLDVTNEYDVRWLRSCIWPEERERYDLLDAALALARQYPPQILRGDACEFLPEILPTIPLDQTLCIWHSFALNQGPTAVRKQIYQT
ncbi:MAG TPA: DUF2332 domain-containing protein, partial [Ktedonobacteraceae bacterium]|nr:DUF2332 domain-containing protein [Ktedonobacteraceae bacterium]